MGGERKGRILLKEEINKMTGGSPDVILALVVASFFFSCAVACTDEGSVSFEYAGNATASWGNLSPDYKTCSTGTHQSPINIDMVTINTKLHGLDRLYMDVNATLINNDYNVMLRFDEDAGFFSQDGKNYYLKQLHWHTPSEHTIDKRRFPLELHLVHKSDDGNISVIGILYDYGNPDPFIYQLKDVIAKLAREHCLSDSSEQTHLSVGVVRTKVLRRHESNFFKYNGSLTTPPCTENVTWYILGKVRKVSKNQIALLRSPLPQEFHNNSRPIQPLNGRVVQLYEGFMFKPNAN